MRKYTQNKGLRIQIYRVTRISKCRPKSCPKISKN